MARSTKTSAQRLRDDLTAAAVKLREVGSDNLAAAVDTVLAPGGWTRLRAAPLPEGESAAQPNLPVRMLVTERDAIKAAAEAAGDILTRVVESGFEEFLAGGFDPRVRNRPRGTHATAGESKSTSLNLSPNGDLVKRVEARCTELNEQGRKPKLAVSAVARAVLQARYRVGLYAPEMDEEFQDKPAT